MAKAWLSTTWHWRSVASQRGGKARAAWHWRGDEPSCPAADLHGSEQQRQSTVQRWRSKAPWRIGTVVNSFVMASPRIAR